MLFLTLQARSVQQYCDCSLLFFRIILLVTFFPQSVEREGGRNVSDFLSAVNFVRQAGATLRGKGQNEQWRGFHRVIAYALLEL